MPTPMSVSTEFAAPVERVYALLTDHDFLADRLAATGGLEPQVLRCDVTGDEAVVVTRQSIPAAALPSMVSSFVSGDPVTERTETWRADGDGRAADFAVVIKGAPATLKGTISLRPAGAGCIFGVVGSASVPIPLFGGKVEQTIVEQVRAVLDREAVYTASRLAG